MEHLNGTCNKILECWDERSNHFEKTKGTGERNGLEDFLIFYPSLLRLSQGEYCPITGPGGELLYSYKAPLPCIPAKYS